MMSGARVRSPGAAANDGTASHSSHVCRSRVARDDLPLMHNETDSGATPLRHSHQCMAGCASSRNE